jgi:serine/threonine protein phosphatase PrpC
MQEAKNTQRSTVRLGYDGRVHKLFRGPKAQDRFDNEARILKYLETRGCTFVPQLLEEHPERLELVTTNCGSRVEQISESKQKELFDELERFGVRHDDPFLRNITYRSSDGRFCLIDFEFATIIDDAETTLAITEVAAPALPFKQIHWSGMTDRGRFRPNNEDAFLTAMLDQNGLTHLGRVGEALLDSSEFVFAVSDGMGGQNSGEFASRIATQKLAQQLPPHFAIHPRKSQAYSEQVLRNLFESIHQALLTLGKYDINCSEMGATLTLVWIRDRELHFAHVGDSRLYHLPSNRPLQQVTEDHTHVGWLKRNGKINEREAREHPRRSVLSQCLGAGHRYLHPQFGSIQLASGDKFVLCTDGVNEGLWDRRIEEIVRSKDKQTESSETIPKADELIHQAVSESGKDNSSVVVLEIE